MPYKDKEKAKEYHKQYSKEYYNNNKEDFNKRAVLWKNNNPEKVKIINKKAFQKYYLTHKKQWTEQNKKYYETHREVNLKASNKCRNRRKREMGFKPLNEYFNGSAAHHIDIINVVYIPDIIHRAIPHRQKKEESMNRINFVAWDCLESGVL